MRIVTPAEVLDLINPVVTVGTFDGVHVGHATVIESVLSHAKNLNGTSVVLTFDPHPRQYIDGANAPALLTSLPEKCARFEALGIDVLAIVPFNEILRQQTPDVFVHRYLFDWLHARHVVVGYDHGFGKDRQGGISTMASLGEQLGFAVTSVDPSLIDEKPVSSTRIRQAFDAGKFKEAVFLLGGQFPVWGVVRKGDGRGRSLGFPTANVSFNKSEKLSPPSGVYAAWVHFDTPKPAVVNFGKRPTFGGENRVFEVHILAFDGDLYGQTLQVELVSRIREERKFENKEALIVQINKDVNTAKQLLSQCNSQ
ncbi:MAG: bifunctional riboflavin kinase/FAD synthetase [Candidatus Latescibacteria bacterium]|jgi:riboflavin kinase / FMN adenylyltransferase|nr:bifunctional riboflavin kinase/FAD synthetase [Candidatus Latescibacterota bacterium]